MRLSKSEYIKFADFLEFLLTTEYSVSNENYDEDIKESNKIIAQHLIFVRNMLNERFFELCRNEETQLKDIDTSLSDYMDKRIKEVSEQL